MMLIDANLLIYAYHRDLPQHSAAQHWLRDTLASKPYMGIPWSVLLAFVRLSTNPRVFERPPTLSTVWEQVELWLAHPNVWIPQPTERHAQVLGSLMKETNVTGNLVQDAHLAALALEHGLILYSADRDFARFPGLRYHNPLQDR
jgi:toxin-antitoxin system PIN domain toxin